MAKHTRAPVDSIPGPSPKRRKRHRCTGEYQNRHKICHCEPGCDTSLRYRQRQEHKRRVEDPDLIQPSETDENCSCGEYEADFDFGQSDSHSSASESDSEPSPEPSPSVPIPLDSLPLSTPSPISADHALDSSDSASVASNDAHDSDTARGPPEIYDDDLAADAYDADDEPDADDLMTLEEMEEELKKLLVVDHEELLQKYQASGDIAYRDQLATHYGINGRPVLHRVNSLERPRSWPHDIMHLFFENIFPLLVKLWSNNSFGRRPPPPSQLFLLLLFAPLPGAPEHFTAEAWCFWFVYLAPGLLRHRLPAEHHEHMCALVRIVQFCLRWDIDSADLAQFEDDCITWALDYERLYYQYREENLPVCTLPIHAIIHIASDIRSCDGLAQQAIPLGALNRRIVNYARLGQLAARFPLKDELELFRPRRDDDDALSEQERCYPDYPLTILRTPRHLNFILSDEVKDEIATYLSAMLQRLTKTRAMGLVPQTATRWGKVRIRGGGDHIRTALVVERGDAQMRDNTFVRVSRYPRIYVKEGCCKCTYRRRNARLRLQLPQRTRRRRRSREKGQAALSLAISTTGTPSLPPPKPKAAKKPKPVAEQSGTETVGLVTRRRAKQIEESKGAPPPAPPPAPPLPAPPPPLPAPPPPLALPAPPKRKTTEKPKPAAAAVPAWPVVRFDQLFNVLESLKPTIHSFLTDPQWLAKFAPWKRFLAAIGFKVVAFGVCARRRSPIRVLGAVGISGDVWILRSAGSVGDIGPPSEDHRQGLDGEAHPPPGPGPPHCILGR
ncbi:hypothetical protein HMN09_01363500 [Mycena chlorophos]|uniref:Uncharacterized protein n=1 Tax=Mycena chlorophos TaxID=658473 RepID=A0A8H6RXQ3_MYCCL|nr:hypothetical protein HMN09_01363500 [Mycena chlorophos]